jgi:hypothetical protein
MKVNINEFRVPAGKNVKLDQWPTLVKSVYQSKKQYKALLGKHVGELSGHIKFY